MEKNFKLPGLSEIKQDTILSATIFFDKNKPDTDSTPAHLVDEPHTYRIELLEEPKIFDGTFGLEGEVLVSIKQGTDFCVDISGNLIVLHNLADKYEINEQGELIYNF